MLRISGGAARGIILLAEGGGDLRPATDRSRQALFSSLGAEVVGIRFADLFAGTGAYGLEAFSRGAEGGVFVESDSRTVVALRRNLQAVARSAGRPTDTLTVQRRDVARFCRPCEEEPPFGIVFADPPYREASRWAPVVFSLAADLLGRHPGAPLVLEFPGGLDPSAEGWVLEKRFGHGRGQPAVGIFRWQPEQG